MSNPMKCFDVVDSVVSVANENFGSRNVDYRIYFRSRNRKSGIYLSEDLGQKLSLLELL